MRWKKEYISSWRKGEMRIFRYKDVKVAVLNDFPNRRVLVFYYSEETKRIYRVAYHGYYAKYLANRIVYTVRKIQTEDEYREHGLFERRSFSYRAEASRRKG